MRTVHTHTTSRSSTCGAGFQVSTEARKCTSLRGLPTKAGFRPAHASQVGNQQFDGRVGIPEVPEPSDKMLV